MKLPVSRRKLLLASMMVAAAVPLRTGADISLFDYGFSQDGVVTVAPASPPVGSMFLTTTGLGFVQMTFAGAGPHQALMFVDHELSEGRNSFFNELGSTSGGSPPPGLSWEIDEPGFVFGDIYDHFLTASLSDSIGTVSPDDVSMALGWSFNLAEGETALVRFLLSETPPSGFHLRHADLESGESVYFASSLAVEPAALVPEGHTALAALAGLALAVASVRRSRSRRERPRPHDGADAA